MADYDFSTLNSSDFEELVCDLLNARNKAQGKSIFFRTFKEGKDKGIDFLYSSSVGDYQIVGQVKHYFKSGFDVLFRVLKKDEVEKVKRLNPESYVIVVSVELSVANAQAIKELFSPYIKSLSDVHGRRELNRYLDEFPDVLKNHFKLWFSSSNVLAKLLNYSIEGRSSEFIEGDLKKRFRLFVPTTQFSKAKETLSKNKFIIITGEPGVGKTTLAELLIYEFIKEDFDLIYVYDEIKEIEGKLRNDDSKQIFYFDDFLGHNSVEIQKTKGSESALVKILQRISRANNKYFILTTRTFLLNSAVEESQRLRDFELKAKESLLSLKDYDSATKEKILLNHVEESNIKEELKSVFRNKEILFFIVNHRNFSPRSIQFVTSADKVGMFGPEQLENFIKTNFDKPDEIWRHAYEQQIKEIDRFFLCTLLSFGDLVLIEDLEEAFNARLDYEVRRNNFSKPTHAFKTTYKRLEGGFILNEYEKAYEDDFQAESILFVKFINPSLVDFLINYVGTDADARDRIINSAVFLEQLTTRLFRMFETKNRPALPEELENKLLTDYMLFIKKGREDHDFILLSMLLYKYVAFEKSEPLIVLLLNKVSNWQILEDNTYLGEQFKIFIGLIDSEPLTKVVKNLLVSVFPSLLLITSNMEEVIEYIKLIERKYQVNVKDFNFNRNKNDDHLTYLFNEKIEEVVDTLMSSLYSDHEVDEEQRHLMEEKKQLEELGFNIEADFSPFFDVDWYDIAQDNLLKYFMEKDD